MNNQLAKARRDLAESLSQASRNRQDTAHQAYLATLRDRRSDANQFRLKQAEALLRKAGYAPASDGSGDWMHDCPPN